MADIDVTVRVRAVLLAALTACAACGGGGGGDGGTVVGVSPPPPPPPTVPPPPPVPVVTARAVASATSVQEGQPFRLDASTSSEAGGAALTYAWTQTSGPAVTIASPASAVLNLNAAEVTADTKAEFRVTATSGAVSSAATVEVTFANIAQTPVFLNLDLAANAMFNATYPFAIATIVGNWTYGLVGTTPAAGGPITFTQVEVDGPNPATPSTLAPFSETFTLPATFDLSQALVTGGGMNIDFLRPSFTVTEEMANRYRVFRKTPGGSYGAPIQDLTLTRPCATEYGYVGTSGSLTTQVYVGQRERGFTRLSDTGAVLQELKTGQSLCAMASVRGPINSNGNSFVGGTPGLPELVAVDTTANTVNHFGASTTDPTQYVLKSQAPLRLLSSSSSLKFVAATRMYNTNQYGTWESIAGLAVIYTDGQHQGEHRLVLVGLDPNRIIRQDTRTWTLGVPSDVIFDDLDDDNVPEVIVISSTSPQAMVYETNSLYRPTIPIAVSATPSFVEIGLGATKALPRMSNVMSLMGLFVAYRDKNEVKLFYPPD